MHLYMCAQGKNSLYSSQVEIQSLVEQVLSRDIRSLNQRQRPHNGVLNILHHDRGVETDGAERSTDTEELPVRGPNNGECVEEQLTDVLSMPVDKSSATRAYYNGTAATSMNCDHTLRQQKVVYHLILEGINVSYSLEQEGVVVVEGAALDCSFKHICSRDTDPRSWRHLFDKS